MSIYSICVGSFQQNLNQICHIRGGDFILDEERKRKAAEEKRRRDQEMAFRRSWRDSRGVVLEGNVLREIGKEGETEGEKDNKANIPSQRSSTTKS